jgi:hypothetical protein
MNRIEQIIKGLELINKVNPKSDIYADHDVIYAGNPSDLDMNELQCQLMKKWGWLWNDEYDCWMKFV